jgi:hypothetical protein
MPKNPVFVFPWMSNPDGEPLLSLRSYANGTYEAVEYESADDPGTVFVSGTQTHIYQELRKREQEIKLLQQDQSNL